MMAHFTTSSYFLLKIISLQYELKICQKRIIFQNGNVTSQKLQCRIKMLQKLAMQMY